MLVHADDNVSLTQNATKHNFPCCAVKSCPLVNNCNLLAKFSEFYLPLSNLTPSVRGCSRAIGFIFGTGKLIWLGYNLVKVA